jgi:hypothetical protein
MLACNEQGFTQYRDLKNRTSTLVPLLIKGNEMKTFSKAHVA